MEVCIIGGGFSGIISAKLCQDRGLLPYIITKDPAAGGLWNGFPNEIGVWDSLHTNTSKYLYTYSDYPWKAEDSEYPTAAQVINYLNGYIEKHQLLQYFHFGSTVISLSKHGEDYLVKWKKDNQIEEKIFRYVMVASGHCSKEISPCANPQVFNGTIVKGGQYREPSIFTGKKVVCIGRSFTGSDVALEALTTATTVTQIYSKSYLIVKKHAQGIPYDFFFYNAKLLAPPIQLVRTVESGIKQACAVLSLCGNPSEILQEWEIPDPPTEIFRYAVQSEEYLSAVSSRRINMLKGRVKEFCSNGIILTSGEIIEADAVVLGAGYIAEFSFLSEEIKNILQYQENDPFLSVVTYRSMLHPALPRLCFVDSVFLAHPGRFEITAEIGVRYLLGELNVSEEEMWQGVRDEEFIRDNLRDFAVPYSYMEFFKECLRILEIKVDFEIIKKELQFANGPFLPQMIWMDRPGQMELAKEIIAEIKARFPCFDFN